MTSRRLRQRAEDFVEDYIHSVDGHVKNTALSELKYMLGEAERKGAQREMRQYAQWAHENASASAETSEDAEQAYREAAGEAEGRSKHPVVAGDS